MILALYVLYKYVRIMYDHRPNFSDNYNAMYSMLTHIKLSYLIPIQFFLNHERPSTDSELKRKERKLFSGLSFAKQTFL